jgi:acyl transferase domain-containing protein
LASVAYTLQTGREPKTHRVVFCVADVDALEARLREYIADRPDVMGCYRGRATKRDRGATATQAAAAAAVQTRDLDALARLWVEGADITWDELYTAGKPMRINLPTYPFLRTRYAEALGDRAHLIHPMIHEEISVQEEVYA